MLEDCLTYELNEYDMEQYGQYRIHPKIQNNDYTYDVVVSKYVSYTIPAIAFALPNIIQIR